MYSKGEYRKDILLKNAKELFYEKGYRNTTIREIAAKSGDPVSLVHYYFQKKDDILRTVYSDFCNNIDLFLYTKYADQGIEQDILLAHALNNRIYYDILLKDPCNSRVYGEILESSTNAGLIGRYVEYTSQKYVDQYQISVSEEQLKACIAINFGGRREFYREYLSGRLPLDIQEGVSLIFSIFPRLIGIDTREIDRALTQSLEIFRQLPDTGIRFLA